MKRKINCAVVDLFSLETGREREISTCTFPLLWKYQGHIPETNSSLFIMTKAICTNAVLDNILHFLKCNNYAKKSLNIATRELILSVAFHKHPFQQTEFSVRKLSQLPGIHKDALKCCISNETSLKDVRFKQYKKETQSNSWEKEWYVNVCSTSYSYFCNCFQQF